MLNELASLHFKFARSLLTLTYLYYRLPRLLSRPSMATDSLWCKRADARQKSDGVLSSMHIIPITPTTNTPRSEARVEHTQNELSASFSDDAGNSLLEELKQAKMQIATAQQLGFV